MHVDSRHSHFSGSMNTAETMFVLASLEKRIWSLPKRTARRTCPHLGRGDRVGQNSRGDPTRRAYYIIYDIVYTYHIVWRHAIYTKTDIVLFYTMSRYKIRHCTPRVWIYDIVYDLNKRHCTSYIYDSVRCNTMSHDNIRYIICIRRRTHDVVCPKSVNRTYDIVRAIYNTMSYTGRTTSWYWTYDIVRDVRHRRWQNPDANEKWMGPMRDLHFCWKNFFIRYKVATNAPTLKRTTIY